MDIFSRPDPPLRDGVEVGESEPAEVELAAQGSRPKLPEAAAGPQDLAGGSPIARPWRLGIGAAALIALLALAGPPLLERLGLNRPSYQPAAPSVTALSGDTPSAQVAAEARPADSGADGRALNFDQAIADYQAGRYREAWTGLHAIPVYQSALSAQPELTQTEQAVENAPTSAKAHFDLGTAWTRAQLFSLAEVAFKQAIALDHRYLDAYINLGVVYYHLHLLPEALAQYDAALAIDPNVADAHHNRGAVLTQQAMQVSPPDARLLEQAVQEFEQALALNPKLAQSHFSLGVIYNLRGQKEEAIAAFKRFMELDTGSDVRASQEARDYLQQLGQ